MMRAWDSMPIFTAVTGRSPNTEAICWPMKVMGMSWMPCTPCVFWAVSAVITVAP